MTSNLRSWEKDPLFSAAEQVQDSADRLDSTYRSWMHVKALSVCAQDSSTLDFCKRELSTALGIAKWQLEEFEKEVSLLSDTWQQHADDETLQRHRQFIDAINNQLSSIKKELIVSKDEDLKVLPKVQLHQEESDQLAHFLCGSRLSMAEDAKDTLGSCTSPGIGYKEMEKLCQSVTSMSSSGLDRGKVLFRSCNERFSSPNTHILVGANESCILKDSIVDRPKICQATINDADLLCINIDQSNEGALCAASDLLMKDCYSSVGLCIEGPNGHHQSVSLGGSLNCCIERVNGHRRIASIDAGLSHQKDGLCACEYKGAPKQVTSNALSNIWHSVSKLRCIFQVGSFSSNGIKRWKDGECDSCKILCSDIEQSCGIFLSQDGSWSEMQAVQGFWKGVSLRRLIQAICAILTVVGLLCFYLH